MRAPCLRSGRWRQMRRSSPEQEGDTTPPIPRRGFPIEMQLSHPPKSHGAPYGAPQEFELAVAGRRCCNAEASMEKSLPWKRYPAVCPLRVQPWSATVGGAPSEACQLLQHPGEEEGERGRSDLGVAAEAASGSLSTRSVSRVGTVEFSAKADSCFLPASALPSEVPPAAEAATQPSAQAAEFVSRVVPASSAAGDSERHLAASKQLSALSPGEGSILASTAAQAQHHQQLQLLVQQNEEGEEPHKQRQPRLSTDSIVAAPTVKRSPTFARRWNSVCAAAVVCASLSSDASDLGGVFLSASDSTQQHAAAADCGGLASLRWLEQEHLPRSHASSSRRCKSATAQLCGRFRSAVAAARSTAALEAQSLQLLLQLLLQRRVDTAVALSKRNSNKKAHARKHHPLFDGIPRDVAAQLLPSPVAAVAMLAAAEAAADPSSQDYEGYGASPGEEQERQSSQASVPDETASNKCDLVRAELAVNAFKSKCGLMLPQQLCLGPMEAGAVVVGRLLLPRQHQEEQQGERPPHVERSGVRLVIGEELWNVLLPLFSHHIRPQPQHQQSKRLPPLLVVRPQLLCLQSRQQLLAHDGVFGIV
ncbi:uncharacterized protein LOC34619123 [Cyclospora cayetanensis]|uniref:Uncharacterized protein LOC34619123 n=1 Tax=Cyclospora cayetanensis TaxID=88456 RepID=A0A6P6RZC3_9EIME|nr:uncharacterized protein LOC34619123 [Cyclospora cayetanensis]